MPGVRKRAARQLSIALGLLILATGCREETVPPELPPRAIQWQRVSATPTLQRRVLSGIVTAVSDTKLAFEVGGTVQLVEVSLGDRVEEGQALAQLDPEPLELAVRDAEATLAAARARREEARATFSRFDEAAATGAVAQQELDAARATRDARDSQFDAAEARLGLARRDLRRSVLRAPFTGVVSRRQIEPAMQVTTGQTAFEMDSAKSGLRVEVQMPETLIARVRQGDRVEVGFPSKTPGIDASARSVAVVSEVGTRVGAGNSFPVRADLEDPPAALRPGLTAEVTFSLSPRGGAVEGLEGFLIPIAAVRAEPDDGFSVFVYDDATFTVKRRTVQTGGVGDDVIVVLEGLEEGDVIATAGVSFLRDGQTVTLLDDRFFTSPR